MLEIAIDAFALMSLLKMISDEEIGFGLSCLVALVASIGTSVLASVLYSAMGFAGILVAALLAAAILGVAISALVGVEIK